MYSIPLLVTYVHVTMVDKSSHYTVIQNYYYCTIYAWLT